MQMSAGKVLVLLLLVPLNEEIMKKRPQMKKKKSALSPRQCAVSHVDRNNGKIARIAL